MKRIHGMTRTPTWITWVNMLSRCHCKTNPRYGGRGIEVCAEWFDFVKFFSDMGEKPSPKHSIERINNNAGYNKGNCRWATAREQARNTSKNIIVSINGEKKCLKDWCSELSLNYDKVHHRVKLGVNPIVAMSIKGTAGWGEIQRAIKEVA
jgi:hypothetical protein